MAKSVQQVVEKWATNAGGAQGAYEQGIQGTEIDVVGRAIAQQSVLLANFTRAVSSGLWARRLTEAGGTAGWKSKTIAKASNYGTGIAAGKDRFSSAMSALLPYIYAGRGQVSAMPKGTVAAAKARASFWIDYMAAYKASR